MAFYRGIPSLPASRLPSEDQQKTGAKQFHSSRGVVARSAQEAEAAKKEQHRKEAAAKKEAKEAQKRKHEVRGVV